jgi:hypothetical protein
VYRRLTTGQIRNVCEEMLLQSDNPSVRRVMTELRQRHGACGSTERVAEILRGMIEQRGPRRSPVESPDLALLRQQLLEAKQQVAAANQRAQRAEEIERSHQDFWAARYQEKLEELQYRVAVPNSAGVSSEQYLRLYRRAMELASRLEKYEEVGPLLAPGP